MVLTGATIIHAEQRASFSHLLLGAVNIGVGLCLGYLTGRPHKHKAFDILAVN